MVDGLQSDLEAQVLLADIRMDGVGFSSASLPASFCVGGVSGPVSLCYVVRGGPIWLEVESVPRRVVRLEPGTVVGLSGVVPHWFKSSPDISVQGARVLTYRALGPDTVDEETQLLIGHAPLETLAFTNTVTGAVIVPSDSGRPARRINRAIEGIEDELRDPDPAGGSALVVRRLSETILINIVRHLMATVAEQGLTLGALGDPRVMRAVAAVARAPLQTWTVEAMADVAGMSRTAFARQFRDLLRDTPLNMVARLRLRIAVETLNHGHAKLDEAAEAAGYGSAAAFIRAFRRVYGTTPAQWRAPTGRSINQRERPAASH
jgi:AraC-like DNA-binding protein